MFDGGAGGAGTANQVRPPSMVLRISTVARQGVAWCTHAGSASSQPADAEMKLADRTSTGLGLACTASGGTVAAPAVEHAAVAASSAIVAMNPKFLRVTPPETAHGRFGCPVCAA